MREAAAAIDPLYPVAWTVTGPRVDCGHAAASEPFCFLDWPGRWQNS